MPKQRKKGLRIQVLKRATLSVEFLKTMLHNMSRAVADKIDEINKRNYYPVPDKDTGSNLAKTIGEAAEIVGSKEYPSARELIEDLTEEILLDSARGNIGLIVTAWLSAFLVRLSEGEELNSKTLAHAFKEGEKAAYEVLDNPRKGTVLDPITSSSKAALAASENQADLRELVKAVRAKAQTALEKTTEELEALLKGDFSPEEIQRLKKEKVVDAGAFGFVIMLGRFLDLLQSAARE
ncbi:DAK2 domain-containing protein [Patescibacteria group bacterium]|nr:DAK2 domain-containing protein [Patescibacteria group bacterium]